MVILAAISFVIFSTKYTLKGYNLGQFIFGRDIILPIKYNTDQELINQKNQAQNNKDNNFRYIKYETNTTDQATNS